MTGIPKSSVHRHQQAIQRRAQHPESAWWETEAGSAWLKRLVVGSLFFFGLKHGIGVGEVSQFLKALRLECHVRCSSSALARLQQQHKATIEAYEVAQAEHCQPEGGQGTCVGGDEVFLGLPVLVLAELASGDLFTEVQCEDRRYETWKEQIQHCWGQAGWECHFMVSDRAKALIKLATKGLGCVSVADWFHTALTPLRDLGQTYGGQKAAQAIRGFEQHLPDIARGLQAWWHWALQSLAAQTPFTYRVSRLKLNPHCPSPEVEFCLKESSRSRAGLDIVHSKSSPDDGSNFPDEHSIPGRHRISRRAEPPHGTG